MAGSLRDLVGVDRVLHEPARLLVAALLYPLEAADFLFLLRETGLTKGNLSSHLARLEQAGYLVATKGYQGKVPHTDYRLSDDGRDAFRSYRDHMRRALERLPR